MSRRLKGFKAPGWVRWTAVFLLALAAYWGQQRLGYRLPESTASADETIQQWFDTKQSGQMVTVEGIIDRVLEDDKDGSRHQRFIVRLNSGRTLLVAHNIDLAPRVPLQGGDRAQVRGEYEWNERGGLLHWTHHDPGGDRPGGWIDFGGQRYR